MVWTVSTDEENKGTEAMKKCLLTIFTATLMMLSSSGCATALYIAEQCSGNPDYVRRSNLKIFGNIMNGDCEVMKETWNGPDDYVCLHGCIVLSIQRVSVLISRFPLFLMWSPFPISGGDIIICRRQRKRTFYLETGFSVTQGMTHEADSLPQWSAYNKTPARHHRAGTLAADVE